MEQDVTFADDETIASIATAPGVGGIGIVRVSGPGAFAVGRAIFRPARGTAMPPPSHLLLYGRAVDPTSGAPLDEVLVVFMRAPQTYTREDVVEVHTHGGPLILQRVLGAALAAGARAARAGEMTQRAFLHGRLDLAQAEAVQALIVAQSDAGRRQALRQLEGALSHAVAQVRDDVLAALTPIEASIDFPEDEVPDPTPAALALPLRAALARLEDLLRGAHTGRMLREGARVALVGRPNVGKSSLLNRLLGMERAIVTPLPGTTRDTVEEQALLREVPLRLVDTAGLTETVDPIERLGVERSRAAARAADVLLFVVDGSVPVVNDDQAVAEELRRLRGEDAPVLLLLNKADLPVAAAVAQVAALWPGAPVVQTSAQAEDGLVALEEALLPVLTGGAVALDDVLVASVRHADALRRAAEALRTALAALEAAVPLDLIAGDLREALLALGEVTGETVTGDLLERIFAQFCIGK